MSLVNAPSLKRLITRRHRAPARPTVRAAADAFAGAANPRTVSSVMFAYDQMSKMFEHLEALPDDTQLVSPDMRGLMEAMMDTANRSVVSYTRSGDKEMVSIAAAFYKLRAAGCSFPAKFHETVEAVTALSHQTLDLYYKAREQNQPLHVLYGVAFVAHMLRFCALLRTVNPHITIMPPFDKYHEDCVRTAKYKQPAVQPFLAPALTPVSVPVPVAPAEPPVLGSPPPEAVETAVETAAEPPLLLLPPPALGTLLPSTPPEAALEALVAPVSPLSFSSASLNEDDSVDHCALLLSPPPSPLGDALDGLLDFSCEPRRFL